MKTTILLNLVVLLVTAASVPAATRLVPDEYATIQAAIDAAVDGDVVIIAPDTYTGDGNRDIDFNGKVITVRSENGPNDCIIDCNGTESELHRGFYFHEGEDASSILRGFTISNGFIPGSEFPPYGPNEPALWPIGGGIFCQSAGPIIVDCVIQSCATEVGGGIGCVGAAPVITDCTITDCLAGGFGMCESGGRGAGIGLIENSNAKITNCTITNNKGYYNSCGGGIYSRNSSPEISGCTISQNSARGNIVGGGVYCGPGSNIKLENCIIAQNTTNYGFGGGIFCDEKSNPTVTNCIITRNTAEGYDCRGGGISCGGLYYGCGWTSPTITNCTIIGNTAEAYGGGISCGYKNNTIISNCVFWDNTAVTGTEIALDSYYNLCTVTLSYSDVQGEQDGVYVGSGCILNWAEGNIDADPCFADPNNGDYHLKSEGWRWDTNRKVWTWDEVTSRCIDAGNPGCGLGDELLSVPDDPNNEWGENLRINMGAYGGTAEASMGLPGWALLADLTNDGIVDFVDLAAFVNYWLETGECIPSDLNRSQSVDFSDFAIFAENWLKGELPMDEFGKPGLARYYVPYDNPVEPSAPGYSLPLNLGAVGNYAYMDSKFGLSSVAPLLEQNGFAIIEHDFGWFDPNRDDIVKPYEYLYRMDVPLFVTADTLLHLYHIQFDETLKEIEEREFYTDINALTTALLDDALSLHEQYTGRLKEAAKRNMAYLTVAKKLIQPEAQVPELVADLVAGELAKIDAHTGFDNSDIFIYKEDYSQYVPRGHYTRSEQLKRYFRTLMWYGRMAFLLKGAENWGPMGEALISIEDAKIQTMQAVLLATSIEEVKVGERSGRQIWDRLYAVTSFYVGLADDLTPYEYLGALNKVFGSSFVATDLLDEDKFFTLKVELALLRSPKINGGTGNVFVTPPITPESLDEVLDKTKGMRFMGQRFIPDSYMFQHLVFPCVGFYTGAGDPVPFTLGQTGAGMGRCYPRGLDVMAILGSARAKTILVEGGDTDYVDYALRFDELKAEFDAFDLSDWNRNLYWGWLYSLRALIEAFGEGYPNFMRTQAWEKKELNAALASWTELRHDTILYAKQSYTPTPTNGGPPPPPDVTGYVEPVPEFYGRLLALTRMTRQGLSDLNALSAQATERLVNLEEVLTRLIEIANKELTNQTLSEDDYEYIMGFGKTLEGAVTGVEEKGVKTTLVADVHTYSYEELVVEEGVGYVNLIIVACPIPDGSIVLSAGPVLSYYEFKHPMSDRLTDEAWRELLDSPQRPNRPTWWFQPPLPVPPPGPPM